MPVNEDYPDLYPEVSRADLPPPPVWDTPQGGANSRTLPPPPKKSTHVETVTVSSVSKEIPKPRKQQSDREISCSYGVFMIVVSLIFVLLQIGLMVAYGIFIGLNNGNGGLYTLMIFNIVFAAINILAGIFSIVTNVSIIDCMKDCLRPVQYVLFVVALIAFCVLGVCAVVLNAFIFLYNNLQGMLIMASIVICVNFAAFIIMIILTCINLGWLRFKMSRSSSSI